MSKPPALNEIRKRAAQFALEWRDAEGYERGDAQSFVRDLLGVYGVTESRAALYEKRVRRSSNARRGYIDALVPGLLVIEMKSAGQDLFAAEVQALDYLDDLANPEMPRYVLTSDFKRFRLLDLNDDATIEFQLEEFQANADRLAFLAGYGVRSFGSAEQEAASVKAAKLMAGLYETLEKAGYEDHDASVFLVRALFALYADDAGVWERDLFTEFIETRTAEDGSDLGPQLTHLFQVLGTENRQSNIDELIARFPYVNGGIFDGSISIPAFDGKMRERLLEACAFDWGAISPAVFGSLFQAVKEKEARRELGEHYTTETNILKLIGPMFLDELRLRFVEASNDPRKLERIRADMGRMRFLDPACGCGNFLVVAYREMRSLDLEILKRLQELDHKKYGQMMWFTSDQLPVRLTNFHGIEIDEWPARIASTALHLAEHQANQAMELVLGAGPETLPLDKVQTITVGNALRLDWGDVVAAKDSLVNPSKLFVLGNPPFLGHATRTEEQAQELRDVWSRTDIGRLDYVTGWYAKALELFSRTEVNGEIAFVSTNSITQGEPVPALFGPVFNAGWRIKFAHRTFAWTSEAPGSATVHCVIVGLDRTKSPARVFRYANPKSEAEELPVLNQLNGYLVDGPLTLVEQRRTALGPQIPPVSMGSMPRDGGNLIIEPEEYSKVMSDTVAAKYVRRFVMGKELIHNLPRWCLWLTDLDPVDVAKSPVLRERLEGVRAFREGSRAKSTRQMAATPHLFGQRSQPDGPYIGVPEVFADSRPWATCLHFTPDVIAGNKGSAPGLVDA